MGSASALQTVELRYGPVPLLGCGGVLLAACAAGFLYKGLVPASAFMSGGGQHPEFLQLMNDLTLFGTSPIALAFAAFMAWLGFQISWRAVDPVAFVAGPRGVGIHPSTWRGMLHWGEIESITIAPHRHRWTTSQRLSIRLRQPRGWFGRRMIFVGPIENDEAAHGRVRDFVARYLPAADGPDARDALPAR